MTTSITPVAGSCSTTCSTSSCRVTPRRCGASGNVFLDLEDLLHVAQRTLQAEPAIRDHGLLQSALARPQASAFGHDAYDGLPEKAAALLHSQARNHALVDGNKRLALAATIAFLGLNGFQLQFSKDAAYEFVIAVATGELDQVDVITAVLNPNISPRR